MTALEAVIQDELKRGWINKNQAEELRRHYGLVPYGM